MQRQFTKSWHSNMGLWPSATNLQARSLPFSHGILLGGRAFKDSNPVGVANAAA